MGKPVRFVPNEDIKGLLQCAADHDSIGQHIFQKLLRISINSKTYYSEDYKRMSKRVSYAVMFENHGGMEFGLIISILSMTKRVGKRMQLGMYLRLLMHPTHLPNLLFTTFGFLKKGRSGFSSFSLLALQLNM